MDSTGRTTHIYLNHIRTDRADEWETFNRSVIMPVVTSQRPELSDKVRLLLADGQEDGETLFAFVFDGGGIDDYDLEPMFAAEYGEQEGRQLLQEWLDMFARDQYGWTFHDVSLHE